MVRLSSLKVTYNSKYERGVNMNYGWGDIQTHRHTDTQTHQYLYQYQYLRAGRVKMKTVEILLRLMQVGLYAGGLGGGARGLEGVLRPGGLICLVDRVGGGTHHSS